MLFSAVGVHYSKLLKGDNFSIHFVLLYLLAIVQVILGLLIFAFSRFQRASRPLAFTAPLFLLSVK